MSRVVGLGQFFIILKNTKNCEISMEIIRELHVSKIKLMRQYLFNFLNDCRRRVKNSIISYKS